MHTMYILHTHARTHAHTHTHTHTHIHTYTCAHAHTQTHTHTHTHTHWGSLDFTFQNIIIPNVVHDRTHKVVRGTKLTLTDEKS